MKAWRLLLISTLILPISILSTKVWALERFEQLTWLESDSEVVSLIQYPELVSRVYQENDDQLIWFDLEQSQQLELKLEMIQRAGFSPLFVRQLKHLRQFRQQNRWFEYDLLATDTTLLYMSYAQQAPSLGEAWFFQGQSLNYLPEPSRDSVLSLFVAIELQQLDELLDTFTPTTQGYIQLTKSYQHLRSVHREEIPAYRQRGLAKTGDKLSDRDTLVKRLALVDIDISKVRSDVSWFDASLTEPVKAFQRLHGLTVDGIIGPATIKWLNLSAEDRLSMLALNAERSRIWPIQRETIILVNVPSFDMKYWYSGEAVFESKVVVGKTSRKTPLMATKLDSLILNPTWNVPRKIMVEDILPQVKLDNNYLTKNKIDIVKRWNADSPVSAEEIDWSSVNPKTFPYKMRQQSGTSNALGLYKFNTPNRRAIFLHDTPSKHLFDEETRAFSSGCVRVEKADQFATVLLENQGLDELVIAESSQDTNKAIPLKRRIPVHIIYQTVWFESGEIHYRDDVYRYDNVAHNNGKS
ncbi:L,D-transpeptidase family protein [Vibrio paucivorans]